MAFQSYSIGVGYNVALGSLTNAETVFRSGVYFALVKGRGSFNPGERLTRGNGRDFFEGYSSLIWLVDVNIYSVLDSLRTTYCAGGWDGEITINTTLGGIAYARRNSIMKLTPPNEVDGEFMAMKRYPIIMTKIAVPS
jgi:hypothetical protein